MPSSAPDHSSDSTVNRVRRFSKTRFARIPEELVLDLTMTPIDVRLYALLDRYAGENGAAFPSQKTICADLGRGHTQVKASLRRLSERGWIEIETRSVQGRQTTNDYILMESSKKTAKGLKDG